MIYWKNSLAPPVQLWVCDDHLLVGPLQVRQHDLLPGLQEQHSLSYRRKKAGKLQRLSLKLYWKAALREIYICRNSVYNIIINNHIQSVSAVVCWASLSGSAAGWPGWSRCWAAGHTGQPPPGNITVTHTTGRAAHLGQLGDDLRQQLRGILLAQLVALERLEYCLDLHLVSLQNSAPICCCSILRMWGGDWWHTLTNSMPHPCSRDTPVSAAGPQVFSPWLHCHMR